MRMRKTYQISRMQGPYRRAVKGREYWQVLLHRSDAGPTSRSFRSEADALDFMRGQQLSLPWRRARRTPRALAPKARRHEVTVSRVSELLKRRDHVGVSISAWRAYDIRRSGPCHYCGTTDLGTGLGLDRLDCIRGYEEGNLVPCCARCNEARGHLLDPDEFAAAMQVRLAKTGPGNAWAGRSRKIERPDPSDSRDRPWARRAPP